ncbi:MAG: ATP-binding cassette domain-containing protein [Clostridia bacterium]|nr:ATP-binding cassette domain-containing protein [Clostridia bacterium]
MKIAILGYSGSGKSTLSKYLAKEYDLPILHLDRVQYESNWQERDRQQAIEIVNQFMTDNDNWVIDGNYSRFCQQERLQQADRIVLMLFNRFACVHRVLKRLRKHRHTCRDDIADGCTEKVDWEFFWWVLYKGRSEKRRNIYRHIKLTYPTKTYVLCNQRQLNAFKVNPFDECFLSN